MERHIKNKFIIFSFFMSVLVILVHSINNETNFQKFIVENICQYAIPSFFILSGFLFFVNCNSINILFNKLRKRIKTLIIPYLMWNVIYYFIYLIIKSDVYFSIYNLYDAAINHSYNNVFWYMYQLILIMFLTPLFFYILKNNYSIIIFYLLISFLVISNIDIKIINEDAVFYFFSGAYISKLYNENKIKLISKNSIYKLLVVFILSIILLRIFINLSVFNSNFYTIIILSIIINRLVGSLFCFYIIDWFNDYESISKYMQFNFFLYATHYLITRIMIFLSISISHFIEYEYIKILIQDILFFITPIVSIIFSYFLSSFMKKNFINYYKLLTGDR